MGGGALSAPQPISRADATLPLPETIHCMIVDHADRLHVRIADGAAHEREAQLLEPLLMASDCAVVTGQT